MKRLISAAVATFSMVAFATAGYADVKKGEKLDGAKEFKKHCAVCHPNGGNIINSKKPLGKKALAANNVKTAQDIIKTMRKPGPGMTAFDQKTISDKEARAIADYILKTFK
jgi:cytochrome c6